MVAFISGHRDLTDQEFSQYYKPLIDKAVEAGDHFVICDYNGSDTIAQMYLRYGHGYSKVTIYHMFESPRKKVDSFWPSVGGFKTDEERDTQCTLDSDYDIAWSRKPGSGTDQNIKRRDAIDRSKIFERAQEWTQSLQQKENT